MHPQQSIVLFVCNNLPPQALDEHMRYCASCSNW